MNIIWQRPVLLCMLAVFFSAQNPLHAKEYIASIIIDDIGENYQHALEFARSEVPYTLAILPHTSHARKIAKLAHKQGKEVMLHLPLQSVSHHESSPGTLSLHMTRQQFEDQLIKHIEAIPNLKGINNHMGSLLTQHPGHMDWLMQTIADRTDLYFVDSRTTKKSIALQIAQEHKIPSLKRDVFLDPDYDQKTLEQQFKRFIEIAKKNESALAIAHPYPGSISFLKKNIHKLKRHGIRLVPVSELIEHRRKHQHVACIGTACAGL